MDDKMKSALAERLIEDAGEKSALLSTLWRLAEANGWRIAIWRERLALFDR
jgi:hypothetical protein